MPSFGEVIIHILTTIISSIIDTTVVLAQDVVLLFQILSANVGVASPMVIFGGCLLLAVIIYFLLKMVKGDIGHLVVAILVLVILLMFALYAAPAVT